MVEGSTLADFKLSRAELNELCAPVDLQSDVVRSAIVQYRRSIQEIFPEARSLGKLVAVSPIRSGGRAPETFPRKHNIQWDYRLINRGEAVPHDWIVYDPA